MDPAERAVELEPLVRGRGTGLRRWHGKALLALAAAALLVAWGAASEASIGPFAIATWVAALVLLGALVAWLARDRRALEERLDRYFEQSLDLLCTADFDGRFERLNPAWERTLGYRREDLLSRPFLDFVHPEDRERTWEEAARLTESGIDSVSFRNRYRTAGDSYRWLEWNAHAVAAESRIYAAARDITVQLEGERVLRNQRAVLEATVRERTRALEEARVETLRRLALAAEYRDDETHEHTERVGRSAALIARQLDLPDETVELLRWAAPLHDVGKLGVPDEVLLKPGRLTPEEHERMQEHVTIGAQILANPRSPLLQMAEEIALTHHERWDGDGYPRGLREAAIPLSGRITAVADVFDALTHERPYKAAWTPAAAIEEVAGLAGRHFDPRVVEAFAALEHDRLLEPIDRFDLGGLPPPLSAERVRIEAAAHGFAGQQLD